MASEATTDYVCRHCGSALTSIRLYRYGDAGTEQALGRCPECNAEVWSRPGNWRDGLEGVAAAPSDARDAAPAGS